MDGHTNKLKDATISKKVVSTLIDTFFVSVFALFLVFSALIPVLQNSDTYKTTNSELFTTLDDMYSLQASAKLVQKVVDEPRIITPNAYFELYIKRQIHRSYFYYEDAFNAQDIVITGDLNMTDKTDDELAYYYVYFKIEQDFKVDAYNAETALSFFKESILFKHIDKTYFNDNDINDIATLKPAIAINLYNYYFNNSKDNTYQRQFVDAFTMIISKGLNELKVFPPFTQLFTTYTLLYNKLSTYMNSGLISAYIISFVFVVFTPLIFTRNNVTLGHVITKTYIVSNNETKLSKQKLLLLGAFKLLTNSMIIIVISLFSFGLHNLATPLFSFGKIDISLMYLLLISLIYQIVNLLYLILAKDNVLLDEAIFNYETKEITK